MKLVYIVLILFVCFQFSWQHERKTITFSLDSLGNAECLIEKGAFTQREFYSCLDIRYAEAPVGSKRFKPTEIITSFPLEVYDATEHKQACITSSTHFESDFPNESILDCLYLSVYTPDINGNYSVMVYVTGFDLFSGSNQEVQPYYLMEHDIVLVSIQYRLGVFGFLNTGRASIPGNAGLADILIALKWIQKYVSLFGGNPKSVTLFGHYKVAGIIQLLTMIPEADGLFHQIICQSGSVFTESLLNLNVPSLAINIGITLGCPNILNLKKLSNCLLKSNLKDLTGVFHNYVKIRQGNFGLISIGSFDSLIHYMPYEMKRRGRIRTYRTLMGIVENPSTFLLDEYFPDRLSIFSMNQTNLIHGLGLNEEQYQQFLLNTVTTEDKKMRKNFMTAVHLNDENQIYVYKFRYKSDQHCLKRKPGNPLDDVTLLDDNLYLFPSARTMSKMDEVMVRRLTDLWTSFAKNGEPSIKGEKKWPIYDKETSKFLIIDANIHPGNDFQNYVVPIIE